MKILCPGLLTLILLSPTLLFGQTNDGIKIAEARLAIEKYNDCKAGLSALGEVSPQGKNNALYLLYAGKAFDCLNKYDSALYYYTRYLNLNPNANDIIQRCAEINYQKTRQQLRYSLAGKWYASGEPDKIRTMEQRGAVIRLYTNETEGRRDDGVIFEGELLETGVYKGGTQYSLTDEEAEQLEAMCEKCESRNIECKAGYEDEDGYFFKVDAYREMLNYHTMETKSDVLTVSSDGKKITIKRKYLQSVSISSCKLELNFVNRTIEYLRVEK